MKLAMKILKNHSLRASHFRVKVLEYIENNGHPAAEEIYIDLKKENPTLSKTTVYNILRDLTARGALREISIDSDKSRYDLFMKDHAHFKCEKCNKIFDLEIDEKIDKLIDKKGFKIHRRDLYLYGHCKSCQEKE